MRFTLATMFVLSILSSTAQGVESLNKPNFLARVLGYIGQSTPVYWYDHYITASLRKPIKFVLGFSDEPAKQEYQDFGAAAQQALHIPQDRRVPIKTILPTSPMAAYASGVAEPDGIYANDKRLSSAAFGPRRIAFCHEAVHIKYRDLSTKDLLEWVYEIGGAVAFWKLIKKLYPHGGFKTRCFLTGAVTLTTATVLSVLYARFMERRADIEGAYASGCWACVQEFAEHRKNIFEKEQNPLRFNGYLWANELEQIVQDLKQENKVCEHHHVINEQS